MARLKGNGCRNQKGDPVERERIHKISIAEQRAAIDAFNAKEALKRKQIEELVSSSSSSAAHNDNQK